MTPELARELINIVWALMSLVLACLFLYRLFEKMQYAGWYNSVGNRLMIGIALYFMGSFIARAWTSLFLHHKEFLAFPQIGLLGGTIALVAALCMIRVITKPRWGDWGWFLSFLVAAAASVAVGVKHVPS